MSASDVVGLVLFTIGAALFISTSWRSRVRGDGQTPPSDDRLYLTGAVLAILGALISWINV